MKDFDGDAVDTTITINVADDAPVVESVQLVVDETDGSAAVDDGVVTAEFGGDGSGMFMATDASSFSFGGSTADTLTAGGVEVVVTLEDGSYVGRAGDDVIFTLDVAADGQVNFALLGQLDHLDGSDANDAIDLSFGVKAVDMDGDEVVTQVSVQVNDDGPSISNRFRAIDESDLVDGPISYTQTFSFDFGADGAGTIEPTGNFMARFQVGGQNQDLTSNGVDVIVTVNEAGDGYVGMAGDEVIFTVVIDPTSGEYTYTQFAGIDHPDSDNPSDVIWLRFEVEITDADGDTDTAIISVDVHDAAPTDAPNGFDPLQLIVDETDGVDANDDGVVTAEFGGDGSGMIMATDASSFNFSGSTGEMLTAGGIEVVVALENGSYIGRAGDDVIFTLDIAADGTTNFTLLGQLDHADGSDANDVINLSFGVKAVDADGDSIISEVSVQVVDDAPIAEHDCNTFDISQEYVTGNVITGENGTADNLSNDQSNTISQISFEGNTIDVMAGETASIDGEFGTLNIEVDGSYVYTPFDDVNNGETIYSFNIDNPPGSDRAGDIQNVNTSFNGNTNELSFSMVVEDTAEGFTLAINNGANPKGHGGELALLYFDASGDEPVITVYGYNGLNTQTSWLDGSSESGTQPADQILSSLVDGDAFTDISVTTDADGNKVLSFNLDATPILEHDPLYGQDGDWSGIAFDESIGVWLHPSSGLETAYGEDGYLSQWDVSKQSWYDSANQTTEVSVSEPQDILDQFEYTLVDSDGDQSTATLTLNGETPEYTVSSQGQESEGSLYDSDHFVCEAVSMGVDVIRDFGEEDDDVLDLSALVQNYDPTQQAIDDFVFAREIDGGTILSIDSGGSGDESKAVDLVALEGVTDLDLQALFESGNINLL